MNTTIRALLGNMKEVIIGKDDLLEYVLIALLGGGHVLLEGLPGVGKTKLALALAKSVDGEFKRVQFTPDILPSDITGYCVWNKKENVMEYREGAAITHFLLADEINRASPRVQSSLLEAMEERQITVEGETHFLPQPFMVLATQNDMDHQGTFPLPEAQMDRFFMKIHVPYPDRDEWRDIMLRFEREDPIKTLGPALTIEQVIALQKELNDVVVSDSIREYILDIMESILVHEVVEVGVSPRGSLALLKAAKGSALLAGRSYVLPDDVQKVAVPVLAHRLILEPSSAWQDVEAEEIIEAIISQTPPPVFQ